MTHPYTIPDIDIGPSPIQLPQEPPTVHMSDPQPQPAPEPRAPTREELLAQAMSFLDHEGFDTIRRDPNRSQHAALAENTAVMIRDDSKGKSLLKEPPVFDRDKKKYREWRQKLSCWLKDPKNKVKDDNEKINITLSYIEGDKVSNFVQNIYDRYWFDADEEWTCSYSTLMKNLDEQFLEAS